ncbi:G-type lectin S-receptor-like serine/threonine-protein kinase At4g27290 [Salvia miltiorrhiza]|uniref:G-type lectin S-receptor-like serine/threonine-protein kinase At4g27290 n=1 Tax=Salvia miltiorrhiza TaxID=226208 RepID=UPI0025AD8D87|nr:G-type lectin S-receptor-like serine/threonine-protein kinase At4g27290 [Salvia miltiorrhiza]
MRFSLSCFFLVLCISNFISVCNGSDGISAGESLFPNQTIISKEGKFELGFFTPGNSSSSSYYVGIWYKNIPVETVVWVLNRNYSIQSSFLDTCLLQMSNSSLNLIVNSKVIWRSAASLYVTEALILDTGNFVLRNSSGILWQSFSNPTDTWLPGAMVGFNRSSNDEAKLVSWRNNDDPASGHVSLGMEPNGGAEIFMKKNGIETLWRSGIWEGGTFPSFTSLSPWYNFSFVSREDGAFFTYNAMNESWVVRIVFNYEGVIINYVWQEERQTWVKMATQPNNACNRFARCGPNAVCDIRYLPSCRCLDGFVAVVKEEWDAFDFSGGCRRMRPLQCDEGKTEFMEVSNIKFPAYAETLEITRVGVCELVCRVNCSCTAYANSKGGGCLLFTGDLIDSGEAAGMNSGVTLYVRMSNHQDRTMKGKRNIVIVALVVPIGSGILISGFCICYFVRKMLKDKAPRIARKNVSPRDLKTYDTRTSVKGEEASIEHELPIFSFTSIAASTNNFSDTNKLGEGGFGPVYKAELANQQFVAVKKLSRTSGQGLQEFKNEIELIAKLQHRNLVGILGCCAENEEKILVYEYMPNKSLDSFLFDPRKKARLSWESRVHIIQGIAQGLLYLHHYSRLRIVHRDLKASNILLDAAMNPKISDFGMARIFRGDDLQANTKRIVGTYGYMSPEYAMEGRFSLKSDVFAFGVLVLEIISGKKNTDFYGSDYLSLLGYVWNMWKQERAGELVDPILDVPASSAPLRYIKIGLLCVQENAGDRPLMSDVVAMLSNQQTAVESPQNPAFTVGRSLAQLRHTQEEEICSANTLTVSYMEAR